MTYAKDQPLTRMLALARLLVPRGPQPCQCARELGEGQHAESCEHSAADEDKKLPEPK